MVSFCKFYFFFINLEVGKGRKGREWERIPFVIWLPKWNIYIYIQGWVRLKPLVRNSLRDFQKCPKNLNPHCCSQGAQWQEVQCRAELAFDCRCSGMGYRHPQRSFNCCCKCTPLSHLYIYILNSSDITDIAHWTNQIMSFVNLIWKLKKRLSGLVAIK